MPSSSRAELSGSAMTKPFYLVQILQSHFQLRCRTQIAFTTEKRQKFILLFHLSFGLALSGMTLHSFNVIIYSTKY